MIATRKAKRKFNAAGAAHAKPALLFAAFLFCLLPLSAINAAEDSQDQTAADGLQGGLAIPSSATLTVFFDANGGTCSPTSITVQKPAYPRLARIDTLPWPTRKGYAFDGWHTERSGGMSKISPLFVTDYMVLYAHWTKKATRYYCTFDGNGNRKKWYKLVTSGKKFGTLPSPTRKGCFFLGWYSRSDGTGNKLSSGKIVPGTTALMFTWYAKWAKEKYKVAFYANGGKGKMAKQTMTYGKSAKLRANKFKRSGYAFKGWAKSKADAQAGKVAYKNKKAVKNLVKNGKTVKLYAVWKEK